MKLNFITVVSGLPRSGTSLMMQMLAAGGVPPLTDSIRAADESNPRGYLEFEKVKSLRTDKSWVAQAQGHAVKVIHLLLRELPNESSYFYRVIFMRRPLEEILASQKTMLARESKPSASAEVLSKIYRAQLEEVEGWLAKQSQFASLPVEYHRLIKEPAPVCDEINQFLGGSLNGSAMAAVVDPSLWRERQNQTIGAE
jgi:hypothetical protein